MSKAETSLIIWAGPKSKTSIFRRDTRRRDREGEEEAVKMEDESRDDGDAAASQRTSGATRS